MQILWSEQALNTFLSIANYILEHWTINEVDDFDNSVKQLIKLLKANKHLCPKSKINNLHKCVVSKQTSLIYSAEDDTITLITFVDNRTLHQY